MRFEPIRGVISPIVTPLKPDGAVNLNMLAPLVDFLIAAGIKGIYPLGTTGEGLLFSPAERKAVAAATVEAVAGRVPVIIHSGAITTRETLDLTQHAQAIGANAAAIITPFYFRHSEAALEQHYRTILRALPDFPIYLYNLPAMSGNVLTTALVTRLARAHPNAVGLKDSSGDLTTLFATNHLHKGRFNTAIGPDSLILAGLAMGLDAAVAGHTNLLPEAVIGIHRAVAGGDLPQAQRLQKQLNAAAEVLGSGGNWLALVKGLMAERGLPVGGVRPPLLSASSETIRAASAQLRALRVNLEAV